MHFRFSHKAPAQGIVRTTGAAALSLLLGCGAQYRPVVSAINPVGPASQPTKYAVAVSSPSPGANGLLTIVDFSGDTILATPEILPDPTYFITLANTEGFAINAQNTLSAIPLGNPPALLTSNVIDTLLPSAAGAISLSTFSLNGTSRLFVPEVGRSAVAILSTATPALQQELGVPANPVYVVGANGTPRAYVISNGAGTGVGQVSAIEGPGSSTNGSSLSVSATLNVGVDPVYGVETADDRRAFILNKGSGTVSVINVTNNALDVAHPVLPAAGTLGVNPVWADLSTLTNELVVLNAGDGVTPGSLSIISIPLCSAVVLPGNPSCDTTNPTDAAAFGTVIATVPVGVNPSMVSVLADGSRAYVINSGMLPGVNASYPNGIEGSVSVVNLVNNTVSATIPGLSAAALTSDPSISPAFVYGHPNSLAVTTGTPTGKVYVTSPDSRFLTVIETDTDTVDTHINLQGMGVRVRTTIQ